MEIKMKFRVLFALFFLCLLVNISSAQEKNSVQIIPAAHLMKDYLHKLKNNRVALLINQTATVGRTLLLDTLLKKQVHIVKVFVPEHGFRGNADAGAHIKSDVDAQTGLPIISLYGKNKKPSKEQLQDVDILVYDLQDVGTRFYTYISTLQYAMEACADNNKKLIILDRPNPNGHYVDGPVLEKKYQSFVGMQMIPVVYGMTVGEYARMLVGEHWLATSKKLTYEVIACKGYDHTKKYQLQVAPSPNLKTMAAIYLYPSLCFFEGTAISVGRGTDKPFEQWGSSALKGVFTDSFTPRSTIGANKPMFEGEVCYGKIITAQPNKMDVQWLLAAYKFYPEKNKFFNSFFEKLAGTDVLRKQIIAGKTAEEIHASWQKDINTFKKVRKKYLLYKDFE